MLLRRILILLAALSLAACGGAPLADQATVPATPATRTFLAGDRDALLVDSVILSDQIVISVRRRGGSASAFAFATGVAARLPVTAMPLHALAGAVAYSRVHTGVHYPGDVLVGSVMGTVIAQLTTRSVRRYFGWR